MMTLEIFHNMIVIEVIRDKLKTTRKTMALVSLIEYVVTKQPLL